MRRLALLALLLALVSTSVVRGQGASFTVFGTSCAVGRDRPVIGNRGLPRIGARFAITYSGPNILFNSGQQRTRPWLLIGFSAARIPIPPVFPRQPVGCNLWISPDATVAMNPDPNGRPMWGSSWDLQIPNDARLIGATFFGQWVAVHEQCGFGGCMIEWVLSSEGAQIVIGT